MASSRLAWTGMRLPTPISSSTRRTEAAGDTASRIRTSRAAALS